ncbi:hypothetical protein NLJ89_g9488 [Agrocybe chaxingu]|uniref:Uncharacterized protein n=1 Tax=Agrocybe chaxingu TaxID=84603 RepID=A0A9W8MT22_9AGAR|nr:hypothetical protein NLJ89_g9488 [Agrocybe chaxingu]
MPVLPSQNAETKTDAESTNQRDAYAGFSQRDEEPTHGLAQALLQRPKERDAEDEQRGKVERVEVRMLRVPVRLSRLPGRGRIVFLLLRHTIGSFQGSFRLACTSLGDGALPLPPCDVDI